MMPQHVQQEFDTLTDAQKQKVYEIIGWGSQAGKGFQSITTDTAMFKAIEMVKRMGEEPTTVAEPDKTVNHDWDFAPKEK